MSDRPEESDRSRDEIISGEYVLGVLSAAERKKVEARIAVDQRFAMQVRRWERNLQQFNEDYEETAAPAALYAKIETRLFGPEDMPAPALGQRLWDSLAFWRGATIAALSIAVVIGLSNVGNLYNPVSGKPLVAELTGEGAGLRLMAAYDTASGRLNISPAALSQDAPKSLEVWLIEDGKPPVSLGILEDGKRGELIVPPAMRQDFAIGRTIAITLEAFGGSTDGKPHGPVVVAGKTRLL